MSGWILFLELIRKINQNSIQSLWMTSGVIGLLVIRKQQPSFMVTIYKGSDYGLDEKYISAL